MTRKGTLGSFFHSSHHHGHHHHGHHHGHGHGHHHGHHGHGHGRPAPPSSPEHTFSATMMEENISDAEGIITKWDPQGHSSAEVASLFHHSRDEARQLLRAVADLRSAMHFFADDAPRCPSSSALLVRAQTLMQAAMRRLQKELHQILSANRGLLDPDSSVAASTRSLDSASSLSDLEDAEMRSATESIGDVERASALATSDLRAIAECMVSAGYGMECVKVYKLVRRSIVDEGLYKLGFDKPSPSPTHLQKLDWDVLDIRVRTWIAASKVAVRTLFSGERLLCDQVFASSDSIGESCFAHISLDPAVEFLRFPELVASKTKRSPEKVFRLLDMFDSISDLWPDIETVFSYQSTSAVRSQAVSSLLKLGEAVRSTFADFESAIQKDSSKTAVPGGGLHPLSRYVMNYMSLLADYSRPLDDIFADYPLQTPAGALPEPFFDPHTSSTPSSPTSSREGGENAALSPVSARIAWLILVLLCKLDSKAELYREPALAYLFLANNLHYVITKVRGSALWELLGEEWAASHEAKARGYAGSYERLAWSGVVAAIPADREEVAAMDVGAAGERMRRFNEAFEAAYRGQSGWTVADGRVRDELKLSIARKVVPAYREFYERCRSLMGGERDAPAVVRFAPEDLANYISDLFYGGGSTGSSSVSSASVSPVSGSSKSSSRSI